MTPHRPPAAVRPDPVVPAAQDPASPVDLFATLVAAIERHGHRDALAAQRALRRLGWSVLRVRPRPAKGPPR